MPTVFIPSMLRQLTGGVAETEVEGATVGELIERLENRFPGLRERLLDDGRLKSNLAVAIDGEVSPLGLLEKVAPDSEVHFVPAISGGSGRHSAA